MDDRNYREFIEKDTIEQFREQPNIQALHDTFARQLQDLYDFFLQLKTRRNLSDAVGAQLDGVGEIVVLSRREAGDLATPDGQGSETDDETYRRFLVYKILKNTCDCTYPDIIKAFRMFWDRPLYYREDPEQPATMIFDTGYMDGMVDTRPLFRIPLIRAAGVTLKLYARTSIAMPVAKARIRSGLGYAVTTNRLPVLERHISYAASLGTGSAVHSIMETPIGAMTGRGNER